MKHRKVVRRRARARVSQHDRDQRALADWHVKSAEMNRTLLALRGARERTIDKTILQPLERAFDRAYVAEQRAYTKTPRKR